MPEVKTKHRIIILGMGTLGAGNIGVPVLIDLFERLSAHYEIVFYSFLSIDASQIPKSIIVKQPLRWRMPGRLRYFFVAVHCCIDHLFHPASLVFGISIYPASYWATIISTVIRRPLLVQLISTEGGTLPPPTSVT